MKKLKIIMIPFELEFPDTYTDEEIDEEIHSSEYVRGRIYSSLSFEEEPNDKARCDVVEQG